VKIVVDVSAPGALTVRAAAKAATRKGRRPKKITVARTRRKVAAAGRVTVVLKPSRTARRVLARTRKLRTRITLSYAPSSGSASSQTRTVTLRLSKRR
jgi:hypothetical protein